MPFVDQASLDRLDEALGPLRLPHAYVPVEPTAKQEWFLRHDDLEVFFGGAAGPGKSWGLLMAATQYVDVGGYHGLLLRPQLTEFEQPGGLIEVSHDWFGSNRVDAPYWHGGKRQWTFPSGASIRFSYLSHPNHLRQFKGPSYSFVGFDELTGFQERFYRAMFRVLRQPRGPELEHVPVRMRAASNPGDVGHVWVKSRFIDPTSRVPTVVFVPAKITDNPHLDYDNYLKSLAHLDPVDQQRLINGDWDVMEEGGKFNRADFKIVDDAEVPRSKTAVRYWDLAASEPSPAYPDPDFTVGLLLERDDAGLFTIRDVVMGRWSDEKVEEIMVETAETDGRAVDVWIEQEPGATGKMVVSHFRRQVLSGFSVNAGMTRGGDKEVRARPVAAAVANDLVRLVRGRNMHQFLDQVVLFPSVGVHDDCVDALSGAHTAITGPGGKIKMRTHRTRARIPTAADRFSTYG